LKLKLDDKFNAINKHLENKSHREFISQSNTIFKSRNGQNKIQSKISSRSGFF